MISLFNILKKQGISIGENMDADKVISVLSSAPSILSQFPSVSSAVTTLSSIYGSYTSAKDTLASMISGVESAEKALNDAQKLYDKTMATVPGQYTAPPLGGPVVPAASTLANSLLEGAYTALEVAKDNLNKAQDTLNSIEDRMKNQVKSVVDLVFTSKV